MKKKILFCLRDFNHGGIPSCLLQLLHMFDHDRYEVEVYCGDQCGVYKEAFSQFKVIRQDDLMMLLMSNYRKLKGLKKWAAVTVKIVRHVLKIAGFDLFDWYTGQTARRLSGRGVDVAISFAEGFPCQLVSLMNVPKKLTWVHCEYDWVSPCDDNDLELVRYSVFNRIVCVSQRTREVFDSVFPDLSARTTVVHNALDTERIKHLASDRSVLTSEYRETSVRILSVGRVCYQKQFDAIPKIMKSIKQHIDCKWFIVGGGPDNEVNVVKREIEECQMQTHVILLGPQNNPYAYMKHADIVVVPSRYESYPTVVNEAKIVGTPIVCNAFSSVHEIMDEKSGVVSSIDDMADTIVSLLRRPQALQRVKANLSNFEYDNRYILKKVYNLIDDND